jgi:uncharacterized protein (TIGR02996 family)
MTHDEAFLEAIRERPNDDALRLIYADWLEEHASAGAVRAEFIRVQCEKARLPEGSPRWLELSVREEELRARHERDWLGPLGEVIDQYAFRSLPSLRHRREPGLP